MAKKGLSNHIQERISFLELQIPRGTRLYRFDARLDQVRRKVSPWVLIPKSRDLIVAKERQDKRPDQLQKYLQQNSQKFLKRAIGKLFNS